MIEATQFTMQDYEVFKSGTKFDNKFRQAGMELMAAEEKDQRSELNKIGLKEVKRVRVLREASDTEGKTLRLVYETKSDKREIERKLYDAEQKRRQDALYTFPVWIPDAKAYLKAAITELIEWVDNNTNLGDVDPPNPTFKKELAEALEALSVRVGESRLDELTLKAVRVDTLKLLHKFTVKDSWETRAVSMKEETAEELAKRKSETEVLMDVSNQQKQELFLRLDFLSAALCFIPKSLFDKSSFLEHARKLEPRTPPKHYGKPPNRPQGPPQKQETAGGPSKTKLQKQNRQHRTPKAAEEKKEQPQA